MKNKKIIKKELPVYGKIKMDATIVAIRRQFIKNDECYHKNQRKKHNHLFDLVGCIGDNGGEKMLMKKNV